MRLLPRRILTSSLAASVAAAAALVSASASAQDLAPPPPPSYAPAPYAPVPYAPAPVAYAPGPAGAAAARSDGGRFRGGVALTGGAFIVPQTGGFTIGTGGAQGQLGYQINDQIGVYAVPSFSVLFGSVGGVSFDAAALVDYTFSDQIAIGIGPDSGAFLAFGKGAGAGGATYGGRLHFAYYPIVDRSPDKPRRKGLEIGLDMRILVGAVAAGHVDFASGNGAASASPTGIILAPQFTVGYAAF